MKKSNKKQKTLSVYQLKKHVVEPLVKRIESNANSARELLEQTFNKVQGLEDSIELIAQEIARQAPPHK